MNFDNSVVSVVRECGLAHKTIIFVLDEFDLFAQVRPIILVHPILIPEALQLEGLCFRFSV